MNEIERGMAPALTAGPDYPQPQMLIDGVWRGNPGAIDVSNPATGACLAKLPAASKEDLDDAVRAASHGFSQWRGTAPAERCRIMLRAAALIRDRRETIARIMTLEQGKPIAQSRLEVDRAAEIITWDANEGLRLYGRVIPSPRGMTQTVLRHPIGPVAAFSPWNFPASSPARKVGGALAAGCSLVLKPSEETPATAVELARAFQDAGLPPGVLNIVFGNPPEIAEHLIHRPEIRMIAFTGSVPVGKKLAAIAAAQMKPTLMELGGHAPVIVCADTDIPRAARLCVAAKARNSGQVCVSPTRFIVDAKVHEDFVREVVGLAAKLTVAEGLREGADMGPLANARRRDAMEEFVADAVACGARLMTGGVRPEGAGYFYPLTVLDHVPTTARAMREEVFGPLMLIQRAADLDEMIALANSTEYALAAYAFTDSAAEIARLSDEVDCGNLAINHMTASLPETPFGGNGVSGHGREGGSEGVEAYTVTRLVSVQT
jgi:succinate-semialdehyde dehydrogenase / glutarate-semialdehyde dehydrogenase